ncbi:MAG: RNA-binding protein [Candidatus Paceibacterota bacterium]
MNKKLFIGGLPWKVTDKDLSDAFSEAGTVESASVVIDKMTGRSRGFGFVEMATEEDAQKAIEMWNGREMGGRNLVVNEAKPKVER